MKKFVAGMLSFCMIASLATACGGNGGETTPTTSGDSGSGAVSETSETTLSEEDANKTPIRLHAFTNEVPNMVQAFLDTHPEYGDQYRVDTTLISTDGGNSAYTTSLDLALAAGGDEAPDMYAVESAFVIKYTQGDMSSYAATYSELGIEDVEGKIAEAQIAPYSVAIGTRGDGEVVGLGYQATGGAFIYRRSLAEQAFGTSEPDEIAEIIGAGTESWDTFFDAAETLAGEDIAIVSGIDDLWQVVQHQPGSQPWLVDGEVTIDPNREAFFDLAKQLVENNYCNNSRAWQEAWFGDMAGTGERPVFGFFGPAWLINYTLAANCKPSDAPNEAPADGDFTQGNTYGDWAVCESPVGFFWGGTWVLGSASSDKKDVVGAIIEWITLDCTEDGLQYAWANGLPVGSTIEGGTPDCVASSTVMAISDGSTDFLAGQNMFDVFVPANANASGEGMTQYDQEFNNAWQNYAYSYANGEIEDAQEAQDSAINGVVEDLGL